MAYAGVDDGLYVVGFKNGRQTPYVVCMGMRGNKDFYIVHISVLQVANDFGAVARVPSVNQDVHLVWQFDVDCVALADG
ncbi:hypothetical protein [Neomoorella humiferrea]|uniref:hypothetical protein n=1 Tax=Neomoorella humiferrea TaxID=676965 RepID=UPI0030F3FB1E